MEKKKAKWLLGLRPKEFWTYGAERVRSKDWTFKQYLSVFRLWKVEEDKRKVRETKELEKQINDTMN